MHSEFFVGSDTTGNGLYLETILFSLVVAKALGGWGKEENVASEITLVVFNYSPHKYLFS